MKFLIDAQLPPALCGWLRERGHEAVHVFEIGMVAASDVVDKFREGGPEWPGRINAVLRKAVGLKVERRI